MAYQEICGGTGARMRVLRYDGILRRAPGDGGVPLHEELGAHGATEAALRLQAPLPGAAVHEHLAQIAPRRGVGA